MVNVLDIRVKAVQVRVRGLSLGRAGAPIIEDLDFTASPGDAVVVRGPNGSGKTTLLRALAGLLRPDAGHVRYYQERDKVDAGDTGERFASRIALLDAAAYLGHGDGLAPDETPRQHIAFYGRWLRGVPDVAEALGAVGAASFADVPARRLSAGQKRRAALARIVASRKPVWLLDEPAAPLDTDGRILLADVINRRRKAGGIVIAAAHDTLGWTHTKTLQFSRIMPGLELGGGPLPGDAPPKTLAAEKSYDDIAADPSPAATLVTGPADGAVDAPLGASADVSGDVSGHDGEAGSAAIVTVKSDPPGGTGGGAS